MFIRAITLSIICISILMGNLPLAEADTQNSYINFRFGEIHHVKGLGKLASPATRIVVETSHIPESRIFLLEKPYRLVIDTVHTEWGTAVLKTSGKLSIGPIHSYRYGKPNPDTVDWFLNCQVLPLQLQHFCFPLKTMAILRQRDTE